MSPLALFAVLVTPVRIVLQTISEVILRPLGDRVRTRQPRDLSEEEFRNLVDAGSAQGQVAARERRLIHRVFEFSDKNVGQVMTPRERIFALSYDLSTQRLVKAPFDQLLPLICTGVETQELMDNAAELAQ